MILLHIKVLTKYNILLCAILITDSRRLFQRDGAQEWKALAPVLVLILETDKLLSLFDLSEREGIDAASMEWR